MVRPVARKIRYLPCVLVVACSCGPTDRDYARQKTRADIEYLDAAVENFKYDCGRYPTPEEGLSILVTSNNIPGWRGHYLPKPISSDFWGTPYRYRLVNGKPSIISAGKDKIFDTSDDIHI